MKNLEEICLTINNDVENILLNFTKNKRDGGKSIPNIPSDKGMLHDQLKNYFLALFKAKTIAIMPDIKLEEDNIGNIFVRLHHKETGEKIEAIDKLFINLTEDKLWS